MELDGEVLAVAMVLNTTPFLAVSWIRDGLRKYPKTIVKLGRKFRSVLSQHVSVVYATPDADEKNAVKFLKHIGFEQIEDEVFAWRQ